TGDNVTAAPTFFRAIFSASDSGEAIANYVRHVLGRTKAFVILRNDDYGGSVAEGFRRAAARLGIDASYNSFDHADQPAAVTKLAAAEPDTSAIVLATVVSDAGPILTGLRRGNARAPIIGTSAIAGEFIDSFFKDQPEERDRPGFFTDGVYASVPVI